MVREDQDSTAHRSATVLPAPSPLSSLPAGHVVASPLHSPPQKRYRFSRRVVASEWREGADSVECHDQEKVAVTLLSTVPQSSDNDAQQGNRFVFSHGVSVARGTGVNRLEAKTVMESSSTCPRSGWLAQYPQVFLSTSSAHSSAVSVTTSGDAETHTLPTPPRRPGQKRRRTSARHSLPLPHLHSGKPTAEHHDESVNRTLAYNRGEGERTNHSVCTPDHSTLEEYAEHEPLHLALSPSCSPPSIRRNAVLLTSTPNLQKRNLVPIETTGGSGRTVTEDIITPLPPPARPLRLPPQNFFRVAQELFLSPVRSTILRGFSNLRQPDSRVPSTAGNSADDGMSPPQESPWARVSSIHHRRQCASADVDLSLSGLSTTDLVSPIANADFEQSQSALSRRAVGSVLRQSTQRTSYHSAPPSSRSLSSHSTSAATHHFPPPPPPYAAAPFYEGGFFPPNMDEAPVVSSLSDSTVDVVSSSRSSAPSSLTSLRSSTLVTTPDVSSILPDERTLGLRRRRRQPQRQTHTTHSDAWRGERGGLATAVGGLRLPNSDRILDRAKMGRQNDVQVLPTASPPDVSQLQQGGRAERQDSSRLSLNSSSVPDIPLRSLRRRPRSASFFRLLGWTTRALVLFFTVCVCLGILLAASQPLTELQARQLTARFGNAERLFLNTYVNPITDLQALYQVPAASLSPRDVQRLHYRTLSEGVERLERSTQHLVPTDATTDVRRLQYLRNMIAGYLSVQQNSRMYARSRDASTWRRLVAYPLRDIIEFGLVRFGWASSFRLLWSSSTAAGVPTSWWERLQSTVSCFAQSDLLPCPSVAFVEEAMARQAAAYVQLDINEVFDSPKRRQTREEWRLRLYRDWESVVYLETLLGYIRSNAHERTRDYNK